MKTETGRPPDSSRLPPRSNRRIPLRRARGRIPSGMGVRPPKRPARWYRGGGQPNIGSRCLQRSIVRIATAALFSAAPEAPGAHNPCVSAPGIFKPVPPVNEPIRTYAPGSPERASLQLRLEQMKREQPEIPCIIGGKEVETGTFKTAVMPHDKDHVLANGHQGGAKEVEMAIEAAGEGWQDWHRLPWEE